MPEYVARIFVSEPSGNWHFDVNLKVRNLRIAYRDAELHFPIFEDSYSGTVYKVGVKLARKESRWKYFECD